MGTTQPANDSQRWPPAQDGHCWTHCECHRTNPKIPPRLPPNHSSRLLEFPPEILTHIALYLPYPSDAVALSQAHPVFRCLFSEQNQLFWHKMTQPHMPYASAYNNTENYHKKVMDAFRSKDARCQICCVERAYKTWQGFKRRICPKCFEDMTLDQKDIRFLGIPELGYRVQKRYKGQSIHWACWKPDVERAVEKLYPGQNLEDLLKANRAKKQKKKTADQEYRAKTRQAIEARSIEIYKTEFQQLHPLVSVEKFEDYVKVVYPSDLDLLHALVRPKKLVWIDNFARNHVLPVWKDVLTLPSGVALPPQQRRIRRIPSSIKTPVVAYHQERFRTRDTGFNWNVKSEPQQTLLVGTCAICATADLAEYVRRERQKLFPLRPGEEPDRTLVKERQWMTPQELMDHYEKHHTMEFYSTTENVSYNSCEAGKGGFWFWDGIPTGVEGLEQFLHIEKNSYGHRKHASTSLVAQTPKPITYTATPAHDTYTDDAINEAVFDCDLSMEDFGSIDTPPFEQLFNDEILTPGNDNWDAANLNSFEVSSSRVSCIVTLSGSSTPGPLPELTLPYNQCPYNSSPFASSSSSAPKNSINFPHSLIACSQATFKSFVRDKTLEWYRKLYGMTSWPDKDAVLWTSSPTNQVPLAYAEYDQGYEAERRKRKFQRAFRHWCGEDDGTGMDSSDDDEGDDDDGYHRLRATVRRLLEATSERIVNRRVSHGYDALL